jgi:hypothetical protein
MFFFGSEISEFSTSSIPWKKFNYYNSEFKQSKAVNRCTSLPYLLENNKKCNNLLL